CDVNVDVSCCCRDRCDLSVEEVDPSVVSCCDVKRYCTINVCQFDISIAICRFYRDSMKRFKASAIIQSRIECCLSGNYCCVGIIQGMYCVIDGNHCIEKAVCCSCNCSIRLSKLCIGGSQSCISDIKICISGI